MREDQALRPDVPEPRNAAADRACVKITRGLIEEYINGLRRKQHPFRLKKNLPAGIAAVLRQPSG